MSHDGITTFNELVDAQQNIYNVGWDLATLLAAVGLTLTDGDVVTEKVGVGMSQLQRYTDRYSCPSAVMPLPGPPSVPRLQAVSPVWTVTTSSNLTHH